MSYLSAARAVLASAECPLTAREIIAEATRRGLIQPQRKTPEAS